MRWARYPGWGFDTSVFDPLAERLGPDLGPGALVWSAGSLQFWDDLEAGRAPSCAVLFAPVVRYLAGDDWPEGIEARALGLLRRRIQRDAAQGFAWFAAQALEQAPAVATTSWSAPQLLAGLDELRDRDDRRRVNRLRGRLDRGLVIACRADTVVPAGQSRRVAEMLGVPYVELAGRSHAPFCERVDDVDRAIRNALAG